MPRYETGFQPPAPVLRVELIGPGGSTSNVPLLIDSGADVSVVPRSAAAAVGAEIRESSAAVQFLAGPDLLLEQTDLVLHFDRFRVRGTFLVIESEYGVVGRNVLNAFRLILDGPRLEWTIT